MTRLAPVAAPHLGFIGYANSGKTTHLCTTLRTLVPLGWRLGVIKHCHHSLSDTPDSDTELFRRAGAAVVLPWVAPALDDPESSTASLNSALDAMSSEPLDGILVEGFKQASYPKIWCGAPGAYPVTVNPMRAIFFNDLASSPGYVQTFLWKERPLRGGILTGGASRRMGQPKSKLSVNGLSIDRKLKESVSDLRGIPAFIGGETGANIDALTDTEGLAGPLAGILSALRADRHCAWLMLPCDVPCWSVAAGRWLLSQRRPGIAAIAPVLEGQRLPFPAVWESLLWDGLEKWVEQGGASPLRFLESRQDVLWVPVPSELQQAFTSANSPEAWRALTGEEPTLATGA